MSRITVNIEGRAQESIDVDDSDDPTFVTIPNVEIVSTGTYHLASGSTTFTQDDLESAVSALDDPAVLPPRLKVGHTTEFGDGEPCFGKVLNLRLSEDRQTLLGDFVDVPAWLASVMHTAYPSRSMEGALNAKTATGRTHKMVIEAVSLLGVTLPGVKTLEDLSTMYSSKVPEGTQFADGSGVTVFAAAAGDVAASINVEDVRQKFYANLPEEAEQWLWVREIRLDPDMLIIQDDKDGGLYRVVFQAADGEVTFGEHQPVEIVYVDRTGVNASAGRPVATFADKTESRNEKENDQMDPKKIRAALGLAEDATDEEVLDAAKNAKAEDDKDTSTDDGKSTEDGDKDDKDQTEDDDKSPAADDKSADDDKDDVTASDGTIKVDKEVWEQTVQAAREGAAARQEQLNEQRETILASAVSDGKISPASKDSWRKKLVAAPEATEKELESLAPGLIPTKESAVEASSDARGDTYDTALFPEVHNRNLGNNVITKEEG